MTHYIRKEQERIYKRQGDDRTGICRGLYCGTSLSRLMCGKQHFLNFIDFEKAFDSMHRESMWAIMKKYGVQEKIIRMVKIFYEDFKGAVEDQGQLGKWSDIKTGVKQGCNMSRFFVLDCYGFLRNLPTSRGPSWPFPFMSLEFCQICYARYFCDICE